MYITKHTCLLGMVTNAWHVFKEEIGKTIQGLEKRTARKFNSFILRTPKGCFKI